MRAQAGKQELEDARSKMQELSRAAFVPPLEKLLGHYGELTARQKVDAIVKLLATPAGVGLLPALTFEAQQQTLRQIGHSHLPSTRSTMPLRTPRLLRGEHRMGRCARHRSVGKGRPARRCPPLSPDPHEALESNGMLWLGMPLLFFAHVGHVASTLTHTSCRG